MIARNHRVLLGLGLFSLAAAIIVLRYDLFGGAGDFFAGMFVGLSVALIPGSIYLKLRDGMLQ
jgi:hypothetical protein